ncbi:metal-dependent hydrolase [Mesoterricola sediminis]|uniref:Hydrolase n=1 Tax=Mesoterricola sediminis TaxID=2927980 RepID=A0AA48GWV3_9BACT|nr:metal-dependent hydrolase [Mesoterricola sediminis]BDU75885.1 hydrolase [Mesoterricola sediminis]
MFGHALAGLAVGSAFAGRETDRRTRALALVCAVAPDLDWFTGFLDPQDRYGLAHRGLFHSFLAAGALTVLAMALGNRVRWRHPRAWACLAVATFSHGLLDAFTFGGRGVAFLEPFSSVHFVSAWQPIFVSPIPLSGRLTDWLFFSLGTELLVIGLPAMAVLLATRTLRARRAQASCAVRDDG